MSHVTSVVKIKEKVHILNAMKKSGVKIYFLKGKRIIYFNSYELQVPNIWNFGEIRVISLLKLNVFSLFYKLKFTFR